MVLIKPSSRFLAVAALSVAAIQSPAGIPTRQTLPPPSPLARASLSRAYGNLPLYFEPNLGQTAARVQFLARTGGYTMLLAPGETVMVLARGEKTEQAVVRMKIEGSDPAAKVVGLERQPGISAYFIGNDPKKWHPEVPHYARVEYKQVYPGVDLVYYGNQRQLEYDFTLAPGADPGRIRLAYQGAERLRVDESGDLVLTTRLGDLKQHKPRVFQELSGTRVEVAASYRLVGGKVGVEVAAYDRARPLVIDPVLTYSTFLGGSGDDYATGIAVDAAGAAYITGQAGPLDFPMANAYQATRGNMFVTKLNPYGGSGAVTLAYSTYLGGNSENQASGVAVDAAGAAYVTGYTRSTNFPVVNAYQASHAGGSYDTFVTKLNPYGGSGAVTLAYSTYLGGSGEDYAQAIAVDAAGAAYVAGIAFSTDFPTVNAYQASHGGSYSDAFVTKLNPYGGSGAVTVAYSTYLGGNGMDEAFGIAVDTAGAAYVTGDTLSTDFPTANAYQASLGGPYAVNAFVTKLNPYGGSGVVTLAYSTYLGGSFGDFGRGIAVDTAGAAYVAGETRSTDFPMANAYQASLVGGSTDAFVAKLNPYGGSGAVTLAYSTYLGGNNTDIAFGIAVDGAGAVYVAGNTLSANFPTANAYQTTNGGRGTYGDGDAFVTKLNPYGGSGAVTLAYSTYLGGSSDDRANGIAVDAAGAAYVTGYTFSPNFPTANAYQSGLGGGNRDAFVTRLDEFPQTTIDTAPTGLAVTVDGAPYTAPASFHWTPGSVHTVTTSSPQSGPTGTRYVFASWSDGGTQTHSVTTPSSAATYRASFTTQYLLSMVAGAPGAVSPSTGYYNAGSAVSISAIPSARSAFSAWTGTGSGSYSGSANPGSVIMNGPIQETASFIRTLVEVILDTAPSGLPISVDGVSRTAPAGFDWIPGTVHTIATFTLQPGAAGTQYAFNGWSDGGALLHILTVPFTDMSDWANFTTQYLLTMNSEAGGTASPPTGYQNAGAWVLISATANAGYRLNAWTGTGAGSYSGVANPSSVIMNGPIRETASWTSLVPSPQITLGGISNAANYVAAKVAPGEIIVVYGQSFGPAALAQLQFTNGVATTTLGNTRIYFDNVAAPMIYAVAGSPSVLSCVVPYAVKTSTQVQVEYNGVKGNTLTVPVVDSVPGIFSIDQSGRGTGAILNWPDYSINGTSNRVAAGGYIMAYATGEGKTDIAVDGQHVPLLGPYPKPLLTPWTATVGGKPATVTYSGSAPDNIAGVFQVNVQIPSDLTPGIYDLVIKAGTFTSTAGITVAVK